MYHGLHLWGDTSLWGELLGGGGGQGGGGGVIFVTTLSLFHFFRNNQHPEKSSVFYKFLQGM